MSRYSQLLKEYNEEKEKEAKAQIKAKLLEYEKVYLPLYHQAALEFANLHDTPGTHISTHKNRLENLALKLASCAFVLRTYLVVGRMKAKNVIHDVVPWNKSREYFYWRLYRRVLEEFYIKQIRREKVQLSHNQALELLKSWVAEVDWSSNKVCSFLRA